VKEDGKSFVSSSPTFPPLLFPAFFSPRIVNRESAYSFKFRNISFRFFFTLRSDRTRKKEEEQSFFLPFLSSNAKLSFLSFFEQRGCGQKPATSSLGETRLPPWIHPEGRMRERELNGEKK